MEGELQYFYNIGQKYLNFQQFFYKKTKKFSKKQ